MRNSPCFSNTSIVGFFYDAKLLRLPNSSENEGDRPHRQRVSADAVHHAAMQLAAPGTWMSDRPETAADVMQFTFPGVQPTRGRCLRKLLPDRLECVDYHELHSATNAAVV
nr:hypothetical protein [Gammaproteobacteria bacterium]